MTRSTNRRAAALLTGATVAAGLLATGCSAGQIAETARKSPSVPGASHRQEVPGHGSVSVTNALVPHDSHGYRAGGSAPLALSIFNDTGAPVRVEITTGGAGDPAGQSVGAGRVTLADAGAADGRPVPEPPASDGAHSSRPRATPTANPSATPTSGVTPSVPAVVTISADGYAVLGPNQPRQLLLQRLSRDLKAGMSVPLRFRFSNGVTFDLLAPVGPPATALPRSTGGATTEH